MKSFLLFRDRDFDVQRKLPWGEVALTQDLELNTLFNAMANDDKFLFDVAKRVIMTALDNDVETILYRQDILRDCLENSTVVRALFEIAVSAIERERKIWSFFHKSPSSILHRGVEVLQLFVSVLKEVRRVADKHGHQFSSTGFTRFFAMVQSEMTDEYFVEIEHHLRELKFRDGVLISAALGEGNKGTGYVLHKVPASERGWVNWIKWLLGQRPDSYTYRLHPRDEAGARALSELRERGINLIANALGQSTDHVQSFMRLLRAELAFYIGCLNLYERLARKGDPICFPSPVPANDREHSFEGLCDACLSLTTRQPIVGNDAITEGNDIVIITGANQGGKSTFLRSIGLAQLMMQSGMFVSANTFRANLCSGLFTHYKREEDATMKSGKFDEELARMSEIVDHLTPNSLMLFNESFAATNDREGSEIANQIVSALLNKHIKVFFVTHLYEFAHRFFNQAKGHATFLRAERKVDRARPFKLVEGEPLQTSYGEDLYEEIFDENEEPPTRAVARA
jgi:DNA mismatch repair ATPase MutS